MTQADNRRIHPPQEDSAAVCETIMERALALIEATSRRIPDWNPPPFDPRTYAETLGIPVVPAGMPEDWDALYVPVGDQPRIIVKTSGVSPGRQNFSIAHEVAHAWFDEGAAARYFARSRNRRKYYRSVAARVLERACDLGAAELLMPRKWFDAAVDRLGLRAASVPKLAAEFAVSLEAAALRLTESCDQPCAVGFFEFDVRPSARESNGAPGWARGAERAYRASRVFRGSGFPFMFPEGKSVPEDSVIHRASFWTMELGGVEEFALGNRRERLRLTAFPLHSDGIVTGPPRVCTVFRRV